MTTVDLRAGDWRTALADVETCDAVITDPPYTSRVAFGYRSGSAVTRGDKVQKRKMTIPYDAIAPRDARDLADFCVERRARFAVIFNDHIGWRWLERAFKHRGWYVFSPVVWDKVTPPPRFQGDGPNDAVEYIFVARPRGKNYVGSLPGIYRCAQTSQTPGAEGLGLVGQKPLALMRAIVRHYSRPGDLVVDPFCGTGTTAFAARAEGRRCITAEVNPTTFEIARRRLAGAYDVDMFEEPPTQEEVTT